MFVGTGVRDCELYAIEVQHVLGDRLHVRGKKTKRADRWLPLRPELAAILKRRAKKTKRGPLPQICRKPEANRETQATPETRRRGATEQKTPQKAGYPLPRAGIEPATRGFSTRSTEVAHSRLTRMKPKKSDT